MDIDGAERKECQMSGRLWWTVWIDSASVFYQVLRSEASTVQGNG